MFQRSCSYSGLVLLKTMMSSRWITTDFLVSGQNTENESFKVIMAFFMPKLIITFTYLISGPKYHFWLFFLNYTDLVVAGIIIILKKILNLPFKVFDFLFRLIILYTKKVVELFCCLYKQSLSRKKSIFVTFLWFTKSF